MVRVELFLQVGSLEVAVFSEQEPASTWKLEWVRKLVSMSGVEL